MLPLNRAGAIAGRGGAREQGSGGARLYFNPIEVVENFCHVALERSSSTSKRYIKATQDFQP
ncbi:hypothetical protein [Allocoleopsis sp.]|uniref:hypothetical protein n=1 Tax=Allocoleopsis sp. TaxID=3088169 RepID=UPI002FD2CED4